MVKSEVGETNGTTTVAEADLVLSVAEVALTVTVKFAETEAGALYVTDVGVELVRVPQAEPVQPVPETLHVTPLLLESLATVAVNCCVAPACTEAVAGATRRVIAGAAAPPPPQPAMTITNVSPKSERAKHVERFITPPQRGRHAVPEHPPASPQRGNLAVEMEQSPDEWLIFGRGSVEVCRNYISCSTGL
jgi:hypothetical protein